MNPGLLLYAVSRRSFRSGGFNFFALPLEGFGNEGGSEYDAETATDFEIGAKYAGAIGDAPTRFNVAAYKMWIEDIQRSNYVSIFGALAGITVNVPEAEVQGIEIDGEIRLSLLAEPRRQCQLTRGRRVHPVSRCWATRRSRSDPIPMLPNGRARPMRMRRSRWVTR